jgi:hypothetical protein
MIHTGAQYRDWPARRARGLDRWRTGRGRQRAPGAAADGRYSRRLAAMAGEILQPFDCSCRLDFVGNGQGHVVAMEQSHIEHRASSIEHHDEA